MPERGLRPPQDAAQIRQHITREQARLMTFHVVMGTVKQEDALQFHLRHSQDIVAHGNKVWAEKRKVSPFEAQQKEARVIFEKDLKIAKQHKANENNPERRQLGDLITETKGNLFLLFQNLQNK